MTPRLRSVAVAFTDWQGIRLRISYEPRFLNTQTFPAAHIQVESIAPDRAPLPITETGYLSWFTSADLVTEAGGPVPFMLQWLDVEATGPAWRERDASDGQLTLFG